MLLKSFVPQQLNSKEEEGNKLCVCDDNGLTIVFSSDSLFPILRIHLFTPREMRKTKFHIVILSTSNSNYLDDMQTSLLVYMWLLMTPQI